MPQISKKLIKNAGLGNDAELDPECRGVSFIHSSPTGLEIHFPTERGACPDTSRHAWEAPLDEGSDCACVQPKSLLFEKGSVESSTHKVEGTDQPILRPATTTRKTKHYLLFAKGSVESTLKVPTTRPATTTRKTKHYLLFAKGSVESTLKVPTTRPATTTRNTATQRSCHSVDYTHTGEDLL